MKVSTVCENYFNPCQKLNEGEFKGINFLKGISYIIPIIPLSFAITYAISLLINRVSKKNELNKNDESVDFQFKRQFSISSNQEKENDKSESIDLDDSSSESSIDCRSLIAELDEASPKDSEDDLNISLEIDESIPFFNEESTTNHDYLGPLTNVDKLNIVTQEKENRLDLQFKRFPNFNISIRYQDLFASEAQVIVNAANSHLGGGGGIDGAIHARGGKNYKQQHKFLKNIFQGNYSLGYASMIASGDLVKNQIEEDYLFKNAPIDHVIVVAGPQGKASVEKQNQLYSCYYNALVLADCKNLESIAFPSISTGIFSFPKDVAAAISLKAIHDFIENHPETSLKTISIHFLKTKDDDFGYYKKALKSNS